MHRLILAAVSCFLLSNGVMAQVTPCRMRPLRPSNIVEHKHKV